MNDDRDIVRAVFEPGGKEYHYRAPGAEAGDWIRSPGMHSDHATVVGFGRSWYQGPVKDALVIKKPDTARYAYTKYTLDPLIIPQGAPSMNYAAITGTDPVEQAEAALKKLKDDRRAAKKAAKKAAAKAAERVRLRKVAVNALERIAYSGNTDAAVAAAEALIRHTA